ncbi:MAG: hypothetical protein CYPHOPRED_004683 [Cyphobasidiales sp. Tagirdzhanova-0007]|nr:MAG: hypothetical protein CYPHOPRED_004683 [Cyphobasidiales sp. Tagirdzhanova-0007]
MSSLPSQLKDLAHEVAGLLKDRKQTISVAETAAGGLISASILSYPGASKIYRGGLTLYTLDSRIAFAGWTQADLDAYAGPSPDVVSNLAKNVQQKLESTYCVCESGTAGPTGGQTRNRQPGYVALAVSGPTGVNVKEVETSLGADREKNMLAFAEEAFKLVKDVILQGDTKSE